MKCSALLYYTGHLNTSKYITYKMFSAVGIRRQGTLSAPSAVSSDKGDHFHQDMEVGTSTSTPPASHTPLIKLNKVAVVGKMTRYEFEKQRYDGFSENEFKKALTVKGSRYETLLAQHEKHMINLGKILDVLKRKGIEYRVCTRGEATYSKDTVDWADAVITAGGDGTFLSAASKIKNREKPLIGINTDPERSEGHLCLPPKYNSNFEEALDKLADSKFQWLYRQRIRITMTGSKANFKPLDNGSMLQERMRDHSNHHSSTYFSVLDSDDDSFLMQRNANPLEEGVSHKLQSYCDVLPVLALNEVFIGESLASVPSYYELQVDNDPSEKHKSSGLCISTGTGSTAWSYNICRLHTKTVKSVLEIVKRLLANNNDTTKYDALSDDEVLKEVTERHGDTFIFDAAERKLLCSIRDPMQNKVYHCNTPHRFAEKLFIRSRCWDATLCVDGDTSFVFNDGATAALQVLPEDALKTVVLDED
ncbi:unnamed protein product [Clavelina lepadiformis]|uniref:NAD(+) kinase n=1 Tax=Clavelina lepadiformis TaxID=159417 RepID=A0ABP0FNX2_CLALP